MGEMVRVHAQGDQIIQRKGEKGKVRECAFKKLGSKKSLQSKRVAEGGRAKVNWRLLDGNGGEKAKDGKGIGSTTRQIKAGHKKSGYRKETHSINASLRIKSASNEVAAEKRKDHSMGDNRTKGW